MTMSLEVTVTTQDTMTVDEGLSYPSLFPLIEFRPDNDRVFFTSDDTAPPFSG